MNIGEEFKGLPIDELIGAPLMAAAAAQGKLALTTVEFIKEIGMENDKVRNVDFTYETTDASSSNHTPIQNKLSVPLLSIVNIPNLSIKEANVDFCMEVRAQSMDKSSVNTSTTVSASFNGSWFCPVKTKITGTIATASEHTRSTDKSAKYTISVKAADSGYPEGLSKVLDILSANVTNPMNHK